MTPGRDGYQSTNMPNTNERIAESSPNLQLPADSNGKRGKSRGGIILPIPKGPHRNSFWECRRLATIQSFLDSHAVPYIFNNNTESKNYVDIAAEAMRYTVPLECAR